VPFRLVYSAAIFFICVGVYSTRNSLFDVGEVGVFGVIGAILIKLGFPLSPVVLGFVLGPMLEEHFRRSLLLSQGDIGVFLQRPISAVFLVLSAFLLLIQAAAHVRALPAPPTVESAVEP
jgi:putative tricarboxylic transport membrane protein